MKIIIVSIDSLRADSLSAYGYHRETSPRIDEIARGGVLFRNAYTQSNWTNPSYYSLITGLYPTVHGITRHDQKLDRAVATLPQLLAGAGYRTFLFSNYFTLLDEKRFGGHFEEAVYFDIDRDEGKIFRKLTAVGGGDLFALVHIGNYVHEPYCAPESLVREFWPGDFSTREAIRSLTEETGLDDESMRNVLRKINLRKIRLTAEEVAYLKARYDAGIKYVDKWLGGFFDFLRERLGGDVQLVITSDHGQGFFEHGFFGHGLNLNQELIKVPLIFWRRERFGVGEVESPVQLIDLFPTLAESAGLEIPALDGVSLKGWIEGNGAEAREVFSEGFPFVAGVSGSRKLIISFYRVMPPGERFRRLKALFLRKNWRKLLLHLYSIFKTSLYDLRADPEEKNNLLKREEAWARKMKETIESWYRRSIARTGRVIAEEIEDEKIIEQLKSLGYL